MICMLQKLYGYFKQGLNFINRNGVWAVGVFVVFVLLWFTTCNHKGTPPQVTGVDSAKYWKDKYGNEHATLLQTNLDKEDLQKRVDSISNVLKIKPKQVIAYVKGKATIDTLLVPNVVKVTVHDTVTNTDYIAYDLDYTDSTFIHIKGRVPSTPQKLEVGVNANIVMTDYWKRKRVLGLKIGKKEHVTDISTDNPYIKLTNAESFKLKDQPKLKLKTGIGIGLNLDPFTRTIHPGIQVGIYLIRSQ